MGISFICIYIFIFRNGNITSNPYSFHGIFKMWYLWSKSINEPEFFPSIHSFIYKYYFINIDKVENQKN